MNDDSMVKIMQALDLDYSKAIFSTMHFGQSIESLNKQLASMKSIAMQSAKDINTAFASQLGQFASNKTIVDQYGNSLITVGNMSESTREKTDKLTSAQRKQSQTIQDIIKQYKAGVVDAQKFVEVASSLKTSQDQWASLPNQLQKDQISLYSQLNKAENEHRKTLNEKSKILKALNQEHKTTVQEVKQSTLESMKAQASSVQQRVTTKGLSDEYSKQATMLREQLSIIQSRLQTEGKLSAEEVAQTQQLKEQLDILKAQTRTAISDDIRENPSTFGQEWERRSSWFLTGAMFYGTINAAKEAKETIKEVEMGMVEIGRVMTDSSFVFNDYRDNLFKLGIDYGQTFNNVQQISLRWAQSGYNVADSLKLTETSLLALNTAELDATQATEAMIGIMAQWQLQAEDMALVMDKINITADRHSVTSQDLVDGLLRSSGAARVMNLSLEETLGLLTVMREASGRTGQEVGNALNSILSYIQRPSAINVLEDLGIQMFTDSAKTQFRNVLDIFKDIASNWNTLSTDIQDGFVQSANDAELFNEELATALGMQEEWNDLQQRDIAQASAGVYRRNYFIGMIERLANVQGVLNNMMDAEGYSMRENADTMETLEKKQESLKASMEALAVAMGDAGLGGSLKVLADGGTGALNMLNSLPKGAKDTVSAFTSTFIAVKTLEMGMKTFGVELPGISQMIGSLTSGTWSLTDALKAGSAGFTAFLSANAPLLALSAAVGVIVAVRNAVKKAREEQEKYIQVTKDNIQSIDEEKRSLEALSVEYNTLKARQNSLTATADEKERLLEIQKDLVETYGVSITGINEEGQAYTDSTDAIRERIKALEEMKAVEQENLETAVMARDSDDVRKLEKNLKEREQIARDMVDVQKQIDEYNNTLLNRGTLTIRSQYGSGTIDASTEHGAKILRDYIGNLSREKSSLQIALNDVNATISEGIQDRELLLKEDAVKITQQLSQNGVIISDSARVYATELAKSLSQAPRNIFELRNELEKAIKDFTSSDFEKWSESYKKAITENDTESINKASFEINNLVRHFAEGKPHLDSFLLATEGLYPNVEQIARSAEKAANKTVDLKNAMQSMGKITKDSLDELANLNQIISDVERNQALSADTVLDLIEKYDLSSDSIKQVTDGYTIEISVLEDLRKQKIKTATDGLEAQLNIERATRDTTLANLKNYALEIEQLRNLSGARLAAAGILAEQARSKMNMAHAENVGFDTAFEESYEDIYSSEIAKADAAIKAIEELEERSKLLTGMINDPKYGVSVPKTKKPKTEKYENKPLEEALKLLEHRKRISEETQTSIQQEIAELNRINSLYVKIEEERMNMAERIYAAEKRLRDKTLQDSINWINEKKNLNELSVEEEIAAWERVAKNQSNNMEAVKQATLNLYKLRNQVMTESFAKEENSIKHLTKLGVYSIQQQIDKYRELYSVKATSIEEEQSRVENLFSLYKSLLSDQQKTIKVSYDERIKQIENEAKARKSAQEDIIKGIEKELELLNRQEDEYDHDKKMADLKEQLAYWQVRTSEDARKKVAELLKQIDEAEHKREVELKKQSLEDKKKIAQDEVKSIENTAKEEREKWEKSYKQIEIAFDDHSIDMIALASTMSKEMFEQVQKNYLIPLERALSSGNYGSIGGILDGFDDFAQDAYDKTYNSNNAQIYRLASSILDLKRQYVYGGDKSAADRAKSYYAELEKLNPYAANKLHASNYEQALEYIQSLPKAHTGGKTFSYGAVYMKPGELIFPPDLSTKLESLISILYQRPISQSSSSFADNRKEIRFNNLLNIEKNYMEDDVDSDILVRQLARQITSLS